MTNNEAIKNINALNAVCGQKDFYDSEFEEALGIAVEALKNQKTGHWINRHNIYANKTFDTKVCSECQYEYSYDAETGISNANYCSNCGAKMEGEKEDNWFAEMEESEKHYEHKKWVESLEKGEQE